MQRPAFPALLYGAGALLVLLLLGSGHLASPLLPLLVPWAAWLAATQPARETAIGCGVAALTLLIAEFFGDGIALRDLAAVGAVAGAAAAVALWWRNRSDQVRQRLEELETIRREARRGEHGSAASGAAARLVELRSVLAEAGTSSRATRVVLWTVDDGIARQRASSDGRARSLELRLEGDPLGWVWREGLPVRLDPTPQWALAASIVDALRLEHGEGAGSLVTFEFEPDAAPRAAAGLSIVAETLRAQVALHDQQARTATDQRRNALLLQTLRRIPAVTEPHAFGTELLAGAVELTDATGGTVATWIDDLGRIIAVAGDDGGPPVGREFGPLESELALAARSGAEIVRAPREPRARLAVAAPGELWVRPPRWLVALPLATPTGTTGALAVWGTAGSPFDERAVELLRALAPYAALQLEQSVEYGKLRDTAERDPLTGLRNRRAFDRALDAEAARLDRYGHPLTLLVIDADHFKTINDRFGHQAGDAVLQDLALLLESEIRDVDVAARFGGEEFVVLLPETDLAAGLDVAERLRRAVETLQKKWNDEPLPITVSVGVSTCPRCVTSPKALVSSADAALYQAKHEGRNRVVGAPPTG